MGAASGTYARKTPRRVRSLEGRSDDSVRVLVRRMSGILPGLAGACQCEALVVGTRRESSSQLGGRNSTSSSDCITVIIAVGRHWIRF